MSLIFNKIIHLVFSKAAVVIANIIVLVVASRYLSMDDYATFRQTFLLYEIFLPLLTLGIPSTIYYLLPRSKDKLDLIFQSMLVMSITSTLFSLFLFFGGIKVFATLFKNDSLYESMQWLIIYPFYQIPISLLLSVYIYEGKTKFVGIYSTIFSLTFLIAAIFLILQYKEYMDLVLLKVFLPIIGSIFLLFYTFIFYRDSSAYYKQPLLRSLKKILNTSIPFGMASMLGAISLQLDKVLVSSFGTTEEFAIYVNGAMEIPLIGVLTGSIAAVLIGEMSKNIKEKRNDKALNLFRQAASKTALVIFPVMIFFMSNAREFITLLYSDKYLLSAVPFRIYLFLLPIRIVVFGSILIAMGKSKVILIRSSIELLLNLVLSIFMFYIFGYLGIAIATVLVTFLWSVPYNVKEISKGFSVKKIELFDIKTLSYIFLLVIILSPSMFISNYFENGLIKIVVAFFVYLFLVLAGYKYFKLVDFNTIYKL